MHLERYPICVYSYDRARVCVSMCGIYLHCSDSTKLAAISVVLATASVVLVTVLIWTPICRNSDDISEETQHPQLIPTGERRYRLHVHRQTLCITWGQNVLNERHIASYTTPPNKSSIESSSRLTIAMIVMMMLTMITMVITKRVISAVQQYSIQRPSFLLA